MMNLLAKSKENGIFGLYEHSRCVEIVAERMCLHVFNDEFNNEYLDKIKMSAKLHDIGKARSQDQNFYNGVEDSFKMVLHNEIGWAILKMIGVDDLISYSVYWHHAKPIYNDKKNNINSTISDILNKSNIDDVISIYKFYCYLIGLDYNLDYITKIYYRFLESKIETPKYYSIDANILISFRNIVVSSDRIISTVNQNNIKTVLNDLDFVDELILDDKKTYDIIRPEGYDAVRFNKQIEISDECINNNDNTIIVKAPAGFGKTILGLIWSLKSNKNLLWVCPRNIIVESVYSSIVGELKNLNLSENISVELFLGGKRVEGINCPDGEYNSNIIITNIDNYLNVVTENRYSDRGYNILNRDVIFDEYHEFISTSAYFSCFVELMKIRHRFTNSKTLLLSATPTIMEFLWDSENNKTKILPNKDRHYDAAHNIPYIINYIDEELIEYKPDSVIISNSIKRAQLHKKQNSESLLLHSKFLDNHKTENINKLLSLYCKQNKNIRNKINVISAPLIQASMDISFNELTEYPMSPENTLQRIGRCNRWGNYSDSIINFVVKNKSKSEGSSIEKQYDLNLNFLWIDYMVNNLKCSIKLNDLYGYYNDFNFKNRDKLKQYLRNKYNESYKNLSKIEPQKIISCKTSKNKTIEIDNKITLRSNGLNIFVTYRKNMSNDWVEPFNEQIKEYGISKQFNERPNTNNLVNKIIKKLVGDERFDFKKHHVDKLTLDMLSRMANNNRTPYIAFNKEYSREYGLADIEIYD